MTPRLDDSEENFDVGFLIQYLVIRFLFMIYSFMPPELSSSLSGFLAKQFMAKIVKFDVAKSNLQLAFPEKDSKEINKIILDMWDNLGRNFAEYSSLEYLCSDMEIYGGEYLEEAIEQFGQAILISGHIGNWEIMAPTLLRYDIPVSLVYREPNNHFVGSLLNKYRSLNGKLELLPKSRSGTRKLVEAVQEGRTIGILIDQKYKEGIPIPFFGQPAMTSPAFAELSQRYKCPIVPFRVERVKGTNFRLTFYPIIPSVDEDGKQIPVSEIIKSAHTLLESWITERPDQWLWIHRRWRMNGAPSPKSKAKKKKKPEKKLDVLDEMDQAG